MSQDTFYIPVPPQQLRAIQGWDVIPAHLAYRIGRGPHLFRSGGAVPLKGGLMVLNDRGFDGLGATGPFCQEVVRECAARGYTGVICDFDRHLPLLGQVIAGLSPLLAKRGWPLYVPEPYGRYSATAKVLIPTALSGGSLQVRLQEAVQQYGAARVALAVERSAEDFFLPSPNGQGIRLTQEELQQRIQEREPVIFFSNELCAHYFTYMNRQNGAHFILFDDAASIRKKLHTARSLDIADALLLYPEVSDLLSEILR